MGDNLMTRQAVSMMEMERGSFLHYTKEGQLKDLELEMLLDSY